MKTELNILDYLIESQTSERISNVSLKRGDGAPE